MDKFKNELQVFINRIKEVEDMQLDTRTGCMLFLVELKKIKSQCLSIIEGGEKETSVLSNIIDSHTCKMELIKTAKYENPKPEDNAWGYGCKTCGKYTHLNYPQSFIKQLL